MNESSISVPISTKQFVELVRFLDEKGSDRDPVEVIQDAIDYWVENADWKQEGLMPETFTRNLGYTWKEVFLPHGTVIRMRYKGQYFSANVIENSIIFKGESITPSRLAVKVAGGARNAWRDLEIKRPKDSDYLPADQLRAAAKKVFADLGLS